MKLDNINKNSNSYTFTHRYSLNHLSKEYQELNGHALQNDFMHIITDNRNMLGEGQEKVVYSISRIKEYVIAVLKGKFNPQKEFTNFAPVRDLLPKYNFGQCIADNGNGIQILKKINGKCHLLSNWFQRVHSYVKNNDITETDALIVLEQLKELEKFPQESFDLLVKKVCYLNRKNVRLDTVNPNNMLIDNIDKEINLVDIDSNFHTQNITPPFNGYNDIAYLLLDVNMHNVYLEKLPSYKRTEFIEVTKNLIKKIEHSAKELGLKSSVQTSRQVYKEVDAVISRTLNKLGLHIDTLEKFEYFNKIYFRDIY